MKTIWYHGDLNTSHVILYHDVRDYIGVIWKFKYISCYSLSKDKTIMIVKEEI